MLEPVVRGGCLVGALLFAAACDTASNSGSSDGSGGQGAQPSTSDTTTSTAQTGAGGSGPAPCTEFVMPPADVNCSSPDDGVLPIDLRCTGLYGNFEKRELACGVIEYKPAYELWSDGAVKRRFVSIPKGAKVNASDPDSFIYPDGTQFWKEFALMGADGQMRLGETRLLRKTPDGWLYTSYVWSEDQSQAIQMPNEFGVTDLHGTGHTVPTRDQCKECHSGRDDFILGWDAMMLGPGAEGMTREKLVELDLLDPGHDLALSIPGNDLERQALGFLHANCGVSCHNDHPDAAARDTGLYLRLEKGELDSVAMTDAVRTGANKAPGDNAKFEGLENQDPAYWYAIRPGDPDRSLLVARQKLRGFEGQMPRIGTNQVDEAGVQLITRWIEEMTEAGGYPPPAP